MEYLELNDCLKLISTTKINFLSTCLFKICKNIVIIVKFVLLFLSTLSRGDHFEMNFILKVYKIAKSLVKMGTSNTPKPNLGPTPL